MMVLLHCGCASGLLEFGLNLSSSIHLLTKRIFECFLFWGGWGSPGVDTLGPDTCLSLNCFGNVFPIHQASASDCPTAPRRWDGPSFDYPIPRPSYLFSTAHPLSTAGIHRHSTCSLCPCSQLLGPHHSCQPESVWPLLPPLPSGGDGRAKGEGRTGDE